MRKPLFEQHIKKLKETDSLKPLLPMAALLTDLLTEALAFYKQTPCAES